ncbi:hypothetical protein Tco_0452066 [Tanacetum coccineum]
MVAYLVKSDENAEFHQIVDFLSTCSINYVLIVSPTIYASYIDQFWNTATSKTVNLVKQIHAIVDGKALVITKSSVRNDLLFDDEDGITCLINDEIFKNLALMGWQSKAPRNHMGAPAQTRSKRVLEKPNEPPLPEGHTSGSKEGSMEHTFEIMDIVPPTPHDSPLTGGYTPGSDEGRLKLKELMAICATQDSDNISRTQTMAMLRNHGGAPAQTRQVESSDDDLDKEDASKQGRISDKTKPMFKDSDFDDLDDLVDEGMAIVQENDVENQGKIGVDDTEAVNTTGEEVSTTAPRTPPTTTTFFDDEDVTMAMAHTLIKMKEEKAKEKGVAIKDVEDSSRPIRSITTLQPLLTIDPKDKVKGILQETEPIEKTKKKVQGDAQIERDAEVALRLQAEVDEELKVERERPEEGSKVAIAKMFDEVQARIDADYELAARMTHEEQEKYIIEERARLLAKLFERRKK